MPITFQVTETSPNPIKKKSFDVKTILPASDRFHSRNDKDENERYVVDPIQSSFSKSNTSITGMDTNSFVRSAFLAYSCHHNLEIRPDDVWISICTQFSNYVNGRSEELRNKFVDFEGKKKLTVNGGGNLKTADYVSFSLNMTKQIAENIKDPSIREWVMPDFTTTTENDKMVGAVVLMSTMKEYFDYICCLMCNLPSVTLLGEIEDWVKIRERANRLVEFDTKEEYMSKWSKILLPILDQFVETIKGNPNKEWWNRIVNTIRSGSGTQHLTGWITAFCIFSDEGKWKGNTNVDEWPKINSSYIPRGYVNVPIKVQDDGVEYDTEMFAGHMVSNISEDGITLQPRVDWALFQINK